jgi:hypothetical protein
MREDEDQFRQYMPVLRRLIILVAVITAIPVAMWTITAVVRTYVGPPKLPTFRPMAAAPAAVGPNEAAAAPVAGEASKGERQPVGEANATASGAGGGTGGMTTDNATPGNNANGAASGDPNAAPAATAGPLKTASLPAANGPANAAPGPDNGGVAQFAAEDQQPPASNWPSPPAANWSSPPAVPQPVAAAPSDAKPLGGNVPLPRKRPATFAIAEAHGIPLPRPRPDAAGPAVAGQTQQATPADWLRNLFGQQGQQPAAAAPEPDGYQAEPH